MLYLNADHTTNYWYEVHDDWRSNQYIRRNELDVPCAVNYMDLLRKNRKERLFIIRRHE